MLTRIEIDGFKSFENFSVDLNPFTAIVGPNGSGKSNLFDAIRLLSRLAERPVARCLANARFGRCWYGAFLELNGLCGDIIVRQD